MPKNEILENITIDKLIFGGKGLGIAPDGRKVIISGGCIPGSIVNVRILKARKSHYEGQELDVIKRSPMEIPLKKGFQMYGGAKWLTIGYEDQLKIKEGQVREAFYHISRYISEQNPPNPLSTPGGSLSSFHSDSPFQGGIEQDPPTRGVQTISTSAIASAQDDIVQTSQPATSRPATNHPTFHPIIPSPEIYGYRNKVEFSWGKYISARENIHDDFRFGFHAQGQFDRIENCTYCALADEETNEIFKMIDILSRASGFPTYDPKRAEGFWRHLVIRKGNKEGEIMLLFSVNAVWDYSVMSTRGDILPGKKEQEFSLHSKGQSNIQYFFTDMVRQLSEKYKNIASIYFLENTGRADIVTGNPILLFGKSAISANLLGLSFEIQPKSFFQVNTLGAEKLYTRTMDLIQNKGGTLLDLYAGTGTIGILLAEQFEKVYSVELIESASHDGEKNALRNNVNNVEFICKKVEDFAREFREKGGKADTIILDPPRDGLHPSAIPHILSFGASEIIYVSCNPATLSRDLELFVGKNRDEKTENLPRYTITDITPVDMFPHTHHIETVVRLSLLD